jgi:transposase-like protein
VRNPAEQPVLSGAYHAKPAGGGLPSGESAEPAKVPAEVTPPGESAKIGRPAPGPAARRPGFLVEDCNRMATLDGPVAGHDYPRTWSEFLRFFPDEEACVRYLERLSWPHGFECPHCGAAGRPWRGTRRRLVCPGCGRHTTVTAGTLFQGTRTPLRQWFAAAWHMATAEDGISASALQRVLGLASYETAWTMLHRYRRAMVRSGRPRLEGVVEVAAFLPLPQRRAGIAVEDRGEQPGRVRMQPLAADRSDELAAFTAWAVEPGATVRAARAAAEALGQRGYAWQDAPPRHLAPLARRVAAWLATTHHGACSPAQLGAYLDEFTFRFNRRHARHLGLLFYRLLEEAVVTPPLPYRDIAGSP